MKCRASIYFPTIGGYVEPPRTYRSHKDVESDFLLLALTPGAENPVADVYFYDSDELDYRLSVSSTGHIVKERA